MPANSKTLPFLPFPNVGQPAGAWAAEVLDSGWSFDTERTGNDPERLKKFLGWVADRDPRRRSPDLTPDQSDMLEDTLTSYRHAYIRALHRPKRSDAPAKATKFTPPEGVIRDYLIAFKEFGNVLSDEAKDCLDGELDPRSFLDGLLAAAADLVEALDDMDHDLGPNLSPANPHSAEVRHA